MAFDANCAYCAKGDLVNKFGYFCCELDTCNVYVFREQSHPGRVILAYKDHVSEIVDISAEQRAAYMEDIAKVANAIHKAFHPDKLNYGMYGDTGCHLHIHLVPKYKDEYEWGGVFLMNPGLKTLTEGEYEEIAQKIRENL